MSSSVKVRTRMAPSPTGELHIGGLRTLLYDYALAKKNKGQFILRLEDTDTKRYVPGSESRLMETVKSYGLCWDEGPDIGGPFAPYVQSQRLEIYRQHIAPLLNKKLAYHCFCSESRLAELRQTQQSAGKVPMYDKHCLYLSRDEVKNNLDNNLPHCIRLNVPPDQLIVFEDLIRGRITFNSKDVDDQVLIKSNGFPTYHFAVVVDDHLMQISHIFRGEEWISSTPKHILLYQYLGWEMPKIAHLTVLLDPEGRGKMSKRHGSTHATAFLDNGYLPEAVLNFLMLLGWNPGDDQEIFSLEEFIDRFDIHGLNKKPVAFDRKKMDYFNGHYLRRKSDTELTGLLQPFFPRIDKKTLLLLAPLVKERITTLKDAVTLTKYLFEDIDYPAKLLLQRQSDVADVRQMLSLSEQALSDLKSWQVADIQAALMDLIKNNNWNVGRFFMVFRVAVAGSAVTPPIVETLPILGKDKTLSRLRLAQNKLSAISATLS